MQEALLLADSGELLHDFVHLRGTFADVALERQYLVRLADGLCIAEIVSSLTINLNLTASWIADMAGAMTQTS